MDTFLNFLQQVLSFTGTFNVNLVLFLFIICAVGEFSIAVPYLLETVWIMTGYNLAAGRLSIFEVIALVASSQVGRNAGAMALFYVSRLGSAPIMKLYRKYFETSVSRKVSSNNSFPFKYIRKINYLSPFSVAVGRLFWLRIPLTLTLGIQNKLKVLSLAVIISSLVWDSVYLTVGVIGASATATPLQMILYSLVGLTALYAITFLGRRIPRRKPKKMETSLGNPPDPPDSLQT